MSSTRNAQTDAAARQPRPSGLEPLSEPRIGGRRVVVDLHDLPLGAAEIELAVGSLKDAVRRLLSL